MKLLLILSLAVLASGCANRTYQLNADGTMTVKSWTFLSWGKLSQFSATKTGVRVGASETGTETEKLAPLIEAAAKGAAQGAMKGAVP